jgi:hypothetical protein
VASNICAPTLPPEVVAVWREGKSIRSVRTRVVAEPGGNAFAIEGLLPMGTALLDSDDRYLGTVIRHLPQLRLSVAMTMTTSPVTGDPYRRLFTGQAQDTKRLTAAARHILLDGNRIAVGVIIGVRAPREVVIAMPLQASTACFKGKCELLSWSGKATGERLVPPATKRNGFELWKVEGAKPPQFMAFESLKRLDRFEPVVVLTPQPRLVFGRVARGPGELGAQVEIDLEEHLSVGAVFNQYTERFIGFAHPAGAGEITTVEDIREIWFGLTGLP